MRPVCFLGRTKILHQSDGFHFISDSLGDIPNEVIQMDNQKTMMFSFGEDKPKADVVIRESAAAMREKGYNPINQLVGYLLSGDPAYVTSHKDARSKIRSLERDDLLDELVRFYLEHEK